MCWTQARTAIFHDVSSCAELKFKPSLRCGTTNRYWITSGRRRIAVAVFALSAKNPYVKIPANAHDFFAALKQAVNYMPERLLYFDFG
jgi:hypothetical protein